jgi:quinohemoprotein ethanol dehydrogenase
MSRRFLLLVAATGLAAATTVALASASQTASHKAAVTPEAASPWLPAGVKPAGKDWIYPSGDLAGSGYSTLTQINTSNVSHLKLAWMTPYNTGAPNTNTRAENQPIVVSGANNNLPLSTGTMFYVVNQGMVAINPESGDILWRYQGPLTNPDSPTPGSQVHAARDEAFGNGLVFAGQQDGSIVALNAKTGAPVWTVQVAAVGTFGRGNVYGQSQDWTYFYDDGKDGLVFSAPNGADSPMRGHFDAFNAKTGKLVWRAFTTPDPTQLPYILTWANPAEAATGGASVWSLPAIDPQLQLIYFGTGNHYPETGSQPGKALWTDSTMALSIKTGALKWYYQQVHHDEWDYDVSNPPVRVNAMIDGKRVPVLAEGGKTGFMYVLNAKNGGPVPHFAIPEKPVPDLNGGKGAALDNTWPTQPEPQGGAGQIVPTCYTAALGASQYPGFPIGPDGHPIIPTCMFAPPYNDAWLLFGGDTAGGINFPRTTYSPQTNDLYICAQISSAAHETRSATDWHQQVVDVHGGAGGTVSALNLGTNKLEWQVTYPAAYTTPGGPLTRNGDCFSGTLATAGGLVFVSANANGNREVTSPAYIPAVFYAYDAKTGKEVWSWTNTAGSTITAPPVTYMVKGKQYIALTVAAAPSFSATRPEQLAVFSL